MEDELGVKGYHNVRIWSSYEAYEEAQKRSIQTMQEWKASQVVLDEEETRQTVRGSSTTLVHPLVLKLYEACDRKDLDLVFALKQTCRRAGLKFDKQRTDMRGML